MQKPTRNKPLVSVIMPVYNAAEFVVAAIESILNQTFQDFELIIVDDASTDTSWQLIKRFKDANPEKITAIRLRNNRNRGGDAAGALAFARASGEYIARMDADDIAVPHRLEKQLKFLQRNKKIAIVGSSATVINAASEVIGQKQMPTTHKEIKEQYFIFHPLIHPTLMIRRSSLPNPKELYRLELPSNNDYFTFFTLMQRGLKYVNIAEPLVYYRMHGKNDSLTRVKRTFMNTLNVRWRMLTEEGYRPTTKAWLKCAAQVAIVGSLPEQIVFLLYLLLKRIYTPTQLLNKAWRSFQQGSLQVLPRLAPIALIASIKK